MLFQKKKINFKMHALPAYLNILQFQFLIETYFCIFFSLYLIITSLSQFLKTIISIPQTIWKNDK